jgi:hypothetical protein
VINITEIKNCIKGGHISVHKNKVYSIENQNREKNKYLYMISLIDSDKNKYTKIGIAKDVYSRFSQLQQQVEYEINLEYKKYLPNTYIIEQAIKNSLKEFNVKYYTFGKVKKSKIELPNYTEWFCIDNKTKNKIINFLDKINIVEIEYEKKAVKNTIKKHQNNISKYRIIKRYGKIYYGLKPSQVNIIKILYKKVHLLWECDFLFSLIDNFRTHKPITKKQKNILRKIYIKYETSKTNS